MSSDWGGAALAAVFVVTEIRKVLTPKIGDIETPSIFLGEGERLAVDLDFRPEAGRVWVVASDQGWGPGGHHEVLWHASARSPKRMSNTIDAPHAGFYGVGGMLSSARGDFRIDWKVDNPRIGPSVLRSVLWLASHAWFVIPLVIVVAAAVWKIVH
jgi:hypothetical protein